MTSEKTTKEPPLVAHCHFHLGRLFRKTGQPQLAREQLMTATAMYREMAMRFWLDRALREMGELP